MSEVALKGDSVTTTHPCTSTTTAKDGCPNVFVGGVEVLYVTGTTASHTFEVDGDGDCKDTKHSGILASNKSTVFVYPDGVPLQIARTGDKYTSCGSLDASPNVTVFAY